MDATGMKKSNDIDTTGTYNPEEIDPRSIGKNIDQKNETSWKVSVSVEKCRCIAYFFFITMCMFAKTISHFFVAPILEAGPDLSIVPIQKQACGPFNREDTGFGVGLGQGFTYPDESHLAEFFGFANVCTAWDYSPSRELTAMYFPLFEYSLVVYLFLDFVTTILSYKRKELPEWFWIFSKAAFFLNVFLCIMFRMIFVCIAYDSPKTHTAGFLGLQVALILVAVQNTLYVIMTGKSYINFSTASTTRIAMTYLFLLLCISAVKVWATVYIVINGVGPDLYKEDSFIPGMVTGQVIDHIWMVFNALIPLFIAIVRMNKELPLEIEFSLPKPTPERSGSEEVETKPLISESSESGYGLS